MAKMIRHDYGAIHDALNKMIVTEVKAALSLVPGKKIEGGSLCRVVVSPSCDYEPRDLCVEKVWLDEDGILCFSGTENHGSYIVDDDPDSWTEDDDLLDITDFQYLIEQIAEQVTVDVSLNITDGLYVHRLSEAVSKTI